MNDPTHGQDVQSALSAVGYAEHMDTRAIVYGLLAVAEAQHTANLIAAATALPLDPARAGRLARLIEHRLSSRADPPPYPGAKEQEA